VRDDNPVMIFEHKLLYGSKGARAESGAVDATSDIPDDDYSVPLGEAAVLRPGRDVTIFGWLLMAHFAQQAATKLTAEGIEAEVVDVRSLSPLDWPTLVTSARKSGRALIVEEGPKTGGVGAEIAAGLAERVPKVRIARLASANIPVPFSPALENLYRPNAERIASGARRLIADGRET
jgi:pyruvate dehydrogenase E1 component beta subunit